MSKIPFCRARVVRFVPEDEVDRSAPEDEVDRLMEESTDLDSFVEVERFLRRTYDWFAEVMAELRAAEEGPNEAIGGFGVGLTNRWESVVEVGVGRKVWMLFRVAPQPMLCFTDHPEVDGSLIFYLAGWHYTELSNEMLVSREACLKALHAWLETDRFPNDA